MNLEYVVLVDEQDAEQGVMEKMQAHFEGRLHRAISVFVFNSKKELLLQKRAGIKYHSAGLWTNTCCSHPKPEESTPDAAHRRLFEEMGMKCNLTYVFNFIYKAELEKGLSEHEFDHVFIGYSDEPPKINSDEVSEYKYMSIEEIEQQIKTHPEEFTVWFKLIFERVKNELNKRWRKR